MRMEVHIHHNMHLKRGFRKPKSKRRDQNDLCVFGIVYYAKTNYTIT